MSDDWIILIPENPHFVPNVANQLRARIRFAEIAPEADEIEAKTSETVQFFDCGVNLIRIACPFCGLDIPHQWWQDRLKDDFTDGFALETYSTPCCGQNFTLHELVYEWPQGFGRFALDAMNPKIGTLDENCLREMEGILGTKLRVIYQHI